MIRKWRGYTNSIGEKIKILRLQKLWTQKYMADQLNMSLPSVSKMETGVTDINFSRLQQVSKLFEITVEELLDRDGYLDLEQPSDDLQELTRRLEDRDQEVIKLRKKIIDLHEELRMITSNKI